MGVVVLLVVAILVGVVAAGKALYNASRGGQVERLARVAQKNIDKASREFQRGRPGAAEAYLKMNEQLLEPHIKELEGRK